MAASLDSLFKLCVFFPCMLHMIHDMFMTRYICLSLFLRFPSTAKIHPRALCRCTFLPILSCVLCFGVLAVHALVCLLYMVSGKEKEKKLIPSIMKKSCDDVLAPKIALLYLFLFFLSLPCLDFPMNDCKYIETQMRHHYPCLAIFTIDTCYFACFIL